MALQACAARPCASTWLGAGIASLRMGDLKAADLAFTEANILNPHNPLVWGFLTLSCLQGDRVPESEMALQFAYKVRRAVHAPAPFITSCNDTSTQMRAASNYVFVLSCMLAYLS